MEINTTFPPLLIIMHAIMPAISIVNNHLNTWFLTDIQGVCTRDHKKEL